MSLPESELAISWQNQFSGLLAKAKVIESTLPFPTVRDEEWKYTPLRALTSQTTVSPQDLQLTQASVTPDIREHLIIGLDSYLLVWYNGVFRKDLSRYQELPQGATLGSIEEVAVSNAALAALAGKLIKPEENRFTARNTAMMKEGLGLHLEKGVALDKPVLVLYIFDEPELVIEANLRNLIRLEKNAQATLIEKWVVTGKSPVLIPMNEISLGTQAKLEHLNLQTSLAQACSVSLTRVEQERDSSYINDTLTWSGKLVRNNLETVHLGINCWTGYNGLYLADAENLIDNHTLVDHAVPHCESNETYKGIVAGHGKAVFNGKVMVRQDAQKTNAYQSNNTLLLGDHALVYAKPQLEIYADDVKCSHGATVGQVDGQELFYLRARGISEAEARKLLLLAFTGEIIDRVSMEALREPLYDSLSQRLSQLS